MLDYIRHQRSLGKSDADIKQALAASGWPEANIAAGFAQADGHAMPGGTAPMTEVPRAKELLKQAWEIYKQRWKTLVLIGLIPTLAGIALMLVVGGGAAGGFYLSKALNINLWALGIVGVLIIIAAVIALIYLSVWGAVAMLFAIKDHQEQLGWKEAFKRSRHKINDFFTTQFLVGIIIAGIVLATVLLGFVLPNALKLPNGASILLMIAAGIAGLVLAVMLGMWYSQSAYVVVSENLKNMAALNRSKHYVQGRIGLVFGKLFFIGLIYILIFIVLAIIAGIIGGMGAMTKGDNGVMNILNNLISVFLGPLATIYYFLLYKALAATRQ